MKSEFRDESYPTTKDPEGSFVLRLILALTSTLIHAVFLFVLSPVDMPARVGVPGVVGIGAVSATIASIPFWNERRARVTIAVAGVACVITFIWWMATELWRG